MILGLMLIVTIAVSVYTLSQMNKNIHEESINKQVESALWYAQEAIESRKRTALSISLMLSRSPSILKAYENSNREAVFNEISHYLESIKSFKDLGEVDVQFHTKDLNAWVRSWNKDSFGMPLSSFRKGLVHVKNNHTPHVSIELGKRLNIKAISPIFSKDDFIGSVEVIVGFEGASKNLFEKGIEFMVLLDKDHLDVAKWERSKSHIGEYVLVSEASSCTPSLKEFAKSSRFQEGFLEDEYRVYGFLPLFNIDATPLGYFGIALLKNNLFQREYGVLNRKNRAMFMPTIAPTQSKKTKIEIR